MSETKQNENAMGAAQKDRDEEEGGGKKKHLKRIVYPVIFAVVIIGCCIGSYLFLQSRNYFSTDNAKVTAQLYSVMPVTSGKLLSWDVENGDLVEQNQVLGRQDTLPYITAPISGTVVKNDGAVGEMVSPTSEIAVIADTANLYIGVNVEETDIARIRLGQTVDVKLDAYPHRKFRGQVTEIDPTTQTYFSGSMSYSTSGTYTKVTQLIPIKVSIENEDNLPLMYGMNATVKIHLK